MRKKDFRKLSASPLLRQSQHRSPQPGGPRPTIVACGGNWGSWGVSPAVRRVLAANLGGGVPDRWAGSVLFGMTIARCSVTAPERRSGTALAADSEHAVRLRPGRASPSQTAAQQSHHRPFTPRWARARAGDCVWSPARTSSLPVLTKHE